jgi:hypothetical protein
MTDSITGSDEDEHTSDSRAARMVDLGFGDDEGDREDVLSELGDDDDVSSAVNATTGDVLTAYSSDDDDDDDDYGYSASGDYGGNFLVGKGKSRGVGAGARVARAGLIRSGAGVGRAKPWDSTGGLAPSAFALSSMRSTQDDGTGSSSDEFD